MEVTARLGEALGQGQEGLPYGSWGRGSHVGFSAASPVSSGHRRDGSQSLWSPTLFLEGEDWFREQGTPGSVLQAIGCSPQATTACLSTLEWRGCPTPICWRTCSQLALCRSWDEEASKVPSLSPSLGEELALEARRGPRAPWELGNVTQGPRPLQLPVWRLKWGGLHPPVAELGAPQA